MSSGMTEKQIESLARFCERRSQECADIGLIMQLDAANKRIEQLEAANGRLVSALQKAVGHPITGDWYDEAIEAIAKATGGANT